MVEINLVIKVRYLDIFTFKGYQATCDECHARASTPEEAVARLFKYMRAVGKISNG